MTDWPNAFHARICTCGHGEAMHNIRANGSRSTCSVSTGAKATPCGCSAFKEAE